MSIANTVATHHFTRARSDGDARRPVRTSTITLALVPAMAVGALQAGVAVALPVSQLLLISGILTGVTMLAALVAGVLSRQARHTPKLCTDAAYLRSIDRLRTDTAWATIVGAVTVVTTLVIGSLGVSSSVTFGLALGLSLYQMLLVVLCAVDAA